MRRSRIAGLLLVSMATLAQQSQPVEITSEPRHHLVLENQFIRVFDVTVEPKGTTLVHRHNHDYLFVTLGDSDVTSARPGEQPAHLVLKDGDTRFTAGNFAHAAINNSDKPFHNITIELLQPSTNVKTCTQSCTVPCQSCSVPCTEEVSPGCSIRIEKLITSDQWALTSTTFLSGNLFGEGRSEPRLIIGVNNIAEISSTSAVGSNEQLIWAGPSAAVRFKVANPASEKYVTARYVTLAFEGQKP